VEAEAVTHLAHQIRVLRQQRGWSQKELARRLGTTQAAVSRLEDASYGRISFRSLVDLGKAFDVAPVVKFVSTVQLMRERWAVRREMLEVPSFEEEAPHVAFLPAAGAPLAIAFNEPSLVLLSYQFSGGAATYAPAARLATNAAPTTTDPLSTLLG
jgi:transcriptional regulator with XRE-family HTH domain